jgi:hypothetical protein
VNFTADNNCPRYRMDRENAFRNCTCEQAVSVSPWWAPQTTVKACAGMDAQGVCGPNLRACLPQGNDPDNKYNEDVTVGFTTEPGRLAARVIIEDRPWDEVLRGSRSPMNGAMQHFLLNFGELVRRVSPPGSFQKPGTVGEYTFPKPEASNRGYDWVERGSLHAGVLTTIAFQRNFNGWRAKANATMEAFLCQKFKVPQGAKQIPSEESDLTRRPYCQSCHSTLEPMSQFFGRWPNLGNTNYFYEPAASASAVGSFNGQSDADTVGLARVFTAQKEFSSCAAERAFEFVVGRTMTEKERAGLLPSLASSFQQNGRKIWPVMKEIILQPAFLGDAR